MSRSNYSKQSRLVKDKVLTEWSTTGLDHLVSNKYFNEIAKQLDVEMDKEYRLEIEETDPTDISIRDTYRDKIKYQYTFDDDEFIFGGQGEYIIIGDNITYESYYRCYEIVKTLNPLANNKISKITQKAVGTVKKKVKQQFGYDLVFIPRTLYEIYLIREFIYNFPSELKDKNTVDDNSVDQVNFILNNTIAGEFRDIHNRVTYKILLNKLYEVFRVIDNVPLFHDTRTRVKGKFFDKLILKAFKLECSPLARIGYILFRGANLNNDAVTMVEQEAFSKLLQSVDDLDFSQNTKPINTDKESLYSLSYGVSLFAGLLFDIGACAYFYMTETGVIFSKMLVNDGYCIFVPFDQINKCTFYIPPLILTEPMYGEGEIFHARTKSTGESGVHKVRLGFKKTSSKYKDLDLTMSCPPTNVIHEFDWYKSTAISF